MQGWRLKREGRILPAGYGFLGLTALLLGVCGYAGVTQADTIHVRDLRMRLAGLTRELHGENVLPERLDAAIALCQEIVATDPDRVEDVLPLGRLLMQRGRLDEAAGLYERALQQHSDDARLHFQYGMLETLRPTPGGEQRALARFRLAARLRPDWNEPQITLAQALLLTGAAGEARSVLENAVNAIPADADVRFALASLYVQIGEVDRAREQLEEAARLAPKRDDIRQALDYLNSR